MNEAAGSMKQGYEALSEKEKQTLRLLLAGHDAKSLARHLGLSVHTINERLRDARRKLSAASSKEAARLLRESEDAAPYSLGDEGLGDAPRPPAGEQDGHPDVRAPWRRQAVWAIGGLAMISVAFALFAVSAPLETGDSPAGSSQASAPSSAAESAPTRAARQWLALVDAGKWQESWAGTARSFQSLNTAATWESVSQTARVPLGRVLSRTMTGAEHIPAPPSGLQLVRFKTDFTNKAGATETLSLAREGAGWRVAGYFIE
jgi:DNA-binding CsgD family transcriptional regulator